MVRQPVKRTGKIKSGNSYILGELWFTISDVYEFYKQLDKCYRGDYHFFLQKEFKWGFLGHPWEMMITVFGDDLIQAFEKHKPRMLDTIL